MKRALPNSQGWVAVYFLDSQEEKAKDVENTYSIRLHRSYVFPLQGLSEKNIGNWNFQISEDQSSPGEECEMQAMKNIDSLCSKEGQSYDWNLYLLVLILLYYLCT